MIRRETCARKIRIDLRDPLIAFSLSSHRNRDRRSRIKCRATICMRARWRRRHRRPARAHRRIGASGGHTAHWSTPAPSRLQTPAAKPATPYRPCMAPSKCFSNCKYYNVTAMTVTYSYTLQSCAPTNYCNSPDALHDARPHGDLRYRAPARSDRCAPSRRASWKSSCPTRDWSRQATCWWRRCPSCCPGR